MNIAMTDEDVRPLHILIPTETHKRLRQMAVDRDRSMTAEARRAIEARLGEWEQAQDDEKAAA